MTENDIVLTRLMEQTGTTIGHLDCGNFTCATIERPWLNNQKYIPHVQVGSCIPFGTYNISVKYSSKFLSEVIAVIGVPNREAILIHPGNCVDDLQGCIAPGMELTEHLKKPYLIESRKALTELITIIRKRKAARIHIVSSSAESDC